MDLMVLRAARSRDLIVASASFLLVAETDGAAVAMDARRTMTMVAKICLINMVAAAMPIVN